MCAVMVARNYDKIRQYPETISQIKSFKSNLSGQKEIFRQEKRTGFKKRERNNCD